MAASRVVLGVAVFIALYLTLPRVNLVWQTNVWALALLRGDASGRFEQDCQTQGTDSLCWLAAEAARVRQDPAGVQTGYQRMIDEDQRRELAIYRLGQHYWQQGNQQKALELWQNDAVLRAFVSACEEASRDRIVDEQWIIDCQLATALAPESPENWYRLALGRELAGDTAAAIDAYEEALRRSDDLNKPWAIRLSRLYLEVAQPDTAVQTLLPYLDELPPDPNVHQMVGRAYYALGDYGRSVEHLAVPLVERPEPLASEHVWYADALRALGRYDDARTNYLLAVALSQPDTPIYRRAEAGLRAVELQTPSGED